MRQRLNKLPVQRVKRKPRPSQEIVLVATSMAEYDDIRRLHPDMEVRLDTSNQKQVQLFDTRGLRDNG